MGLEEHLLGMFREDFEFNDEAQPSHLGHGRRAEEAEPAPATPEPAPAEPAPEEAANTDAPITWAPEAEKELKKIPFFVRGKARRNTESFASERGVTTITVETLYDAKAHYAR
jgi:light-independent protochlorophyllide reductase subunit B